MCRSEEFRISSIILPQDIADADKQKLAACGYEPGKEPPFDGYYYYSLPSAMTKGWDVLPPTAIPPLQDIKTVEHSNNYDVVSIPPHNSEVKLIFPRQWWHGYTATINGKKLSVEPDDTQMLTSVLIPAGESGILKLSFFPVTWKYFLPISLVSFLCALIVAFYLYKKRQTVFWKPIFTNFDCIPER